MKLAAISEQCRPTFRDVRERGFADRASVAEVLAWIDRYSRICEAECVAVEQAVGRFLSKPFIAPADIERIDTAASDGFAVRSCETIGAGSYNPLPFCLQSPRNDLRPSSAALVTAGMPLPLGADTIVPFDMAQPEGKFINVILPVAQGEGVNRAGRSLHGQDFLIDTARPLRESDVGLISGVGIDQIWVTRRPSVRLVVIGKKPSFQKGALDAIGPMLVHKIVRDGGTIEAFAHGMSSIADLADCLCRPGADVVIVCGRTGTGPDDDAPVALATVGEVSIHGIAVQPGGSAGMGVVGKVPVLLLPGNPLECFCAYDLLAGRLIRILSGRNPGLPYRTLHAKAGRKFVSPVGTTELCPVRLTGEEAFPIATAGSADLLSIARADGFVLIPERMEGYAPGTPLQVYKYDDFDGAESLL